MTKPVKGALDNLFQASGAAASTEAAAAAALEDELALDTLLDKPKQGSAPPAAEKVTKESKPTADGKDQESLVTQTWQDCKDLFDSPLK